MDTSYKEYLDIAVLQEKRPVTYKLLARKLGIHVNTAKQALYEYASSQPLVHSVYCITGMIEPNVFHIQLVQSADLDTAKKCFKQLTGVHVYSILPYKPEDLSVLVNANKEIPNISLPDRIKCGILKNATVEKSSGRHGQPIGKPAHVPAPAPISPPAKPIPVAKPEKTLTETKGTTGKRKGTLSFTSSAPNPKKQDSKSKPSDSDGLSGGETSDEEADRRLANATNPPTANIFSDDEDEDDAHKAAELPQSIAPDKEMVDDTMDEEIDAEMEDNMDNEEKEEDAPAEKVPTPDPTPGKIRRKVLKKVTFKDARGYMVTKDVVEWETVDAPAEETKTPVPSRPKPQPANKKTAAKKSGGDQKSLLSFWGKKG